MNIKKVSLPWFLFATLTSLNVLAECNKGNCENGKGTFTWAASGNVYEGDFLDNAITGKETTPGGLAVMFMKVAFLMTV